MIMRSCSATCLNPIGIIKRTIMAVVLGGMINILVVVVAEEDIIVAEVEIEVVKRTEEEDIVVTMIDLGVDLEIDVIDREIIKSRAKTVDTVALVMTVTVDIVVVNAKMMTATANRNHMMILVINGRI